MEQAAFGAGCFWGVESFFREVPGAVDAVAGHAGGHTQHPTYRNVCSGRTGHAEVVQVTFAAHAEKEVLASRFSRPIVTSIEPAPAFWRAEECHQRYFEKNGLPSCHMRMPEAS